jgi:hypothetical protein
MEVFLMEVRVAGTQETVNLVLIDPKTRYDWVRDFIAVGENEDFVYNEDEGVYMVKDRDTLDWWIGIIDAQRAIDARMEALRDAHGDAVDEYVRKHRPDNVDLEDEAEIINDLLDNFEAE